MTAASSTQRYPRTRSATRAKDESIADYVSLLFCGRKLRAESVVLKQRIRNGKIVGYIRSLDATLLQSVGYGSRRGAKKLANFLELVMRLRRESGNDIRTCSSA
jgi:hypothetical protein